MKLEDLEKYVTCKRLKNNTLSYQITSIDIDIVSPPAPENDMFGTMTPVIIAKNGIIRNTFDIESIKRDFIRNVISLSNKNTELVGKNVKVQVMMGSNHIAGKGRIGSATNMIISRNNYIKYDLTNSRLEPYFDDSVEDIILYHKNDINQPGLILIYNDHKYGFVQTGKYPENQFFKISFLKILRNRKLSRVL